MVSRESAGVPARGCTDMAPPPVSQARTCAPTPAARPRQGSDLTGSYGAAPPSAGGLTLGRKGVMPGTPTGLVHRLDENIGAADVELSADELTEIEHAASKIQVQGGRYNEAAEGMTNL